MHIKYYFKQFSFRWKGKAKKPELGSPLSTAGVLKNNQWTDVQQTDF